jgi:hypothetical protein
MLKLDVVVSEEIWDDKANQFIEPEVVTLELEHSLVSLSKWEASWEKPFLGTEEKTSEETLGYIYAMCITPDVSPDVFQSLTNEQLTQVNNYINAKMSATWFGERAENPTKGRVKKEIITSEIIYYWIFSADIDASIVQDWHLNRLFTLLKVFNEKNKAQTTSKVNKSDAAAQRRMLNEQRRQQLKTSG